MAASTSTPAPFYIPVDLSHTALLLADIQDQIAARFTPEQLAPFIANVESLLLLFRSEIAQRRATQSNQPFTSDMPLIIHHIFPHGINSNAFMSPYNKMAVKWKQIELSKGFTPPPDDPNHPHYAVIDALKPSDSWGSPDEILLSKITAGCFGSSELQQYLRARDIKHVILCGLTTSGAILGSARAGADLDMHMIVPRECVMDDDKEVNDFLLERVLARQVDVVGVEEVKALFGAEEGK